MDRTESTFRELELLVDRLRDPGGCPWDREQTLTELRTYLLEETYEVLDAMEKEDWGELRGELGDLLFQIVFIARLARERGGFSLADVAEEVREKMIARHPHVFGEVEAKSAADVLGRWEKNKRKEAKSSGRTPLEGVPDSLPALLKAYRMTDKAAHLGFDWERTEDVVTKLEEELGEWKREILSDDPAAAHRAKEELGDILFVVANIARRMKVDPEDALQSTNRKFRRRFEEVGAKLAAAGKDYGDSTLEEMDRLWNEVKKQEG
jgi:MazG family protein